MLSFFSIWLICSGFLETKCGGNELRGSDENTSVFPEDIKKELVSESDAADEMKVFREDALWRKGTNAVKEMLSDHSLFITVKNSEGESETEVTTLLNFNEKGGGGLRRKSARKGWVHKYYCKRCRIHFRYNNLYEQHFKEKHPKTAPFSCRYCYAPQWFKRNYARHVRHVHPEKADRIPARTMSGMKCELCDTTHKGLRALEMHLLRIHEGAKTFKCTTCEAEFRRKSNLAQHFENSHGVESLPCSYCTKCYGSETVLKYHERTCGKKSPKKEFYFCDICSKWRRGSYDSHKSHHNYYDHCEFCYQRFHKGKNPLGLLKHMKKRHPDCFEAEAAGVNALLSAAKKLNSQDRIKRENDENS